MKIRIALFASGNGTNVQRIAEYFREHASIEVAAVYCNKPDAFVLTRARNLGIPHRIFSREELEEGEVMAMLIADHVDWIILAGFLWKVPDNILEAYPEHIINVHPALLPAYGGKGMYGHRVHEAVIANKEKESGITIHLVDEVYDHGDHLFQARVALDENETPDTLANKIHALEQEYFPLIIEKTLLSN
ncbi:MAG TPA: phosphoribosylglycinamide formyltransferase [Bacteroidetes bacterium]|nr:phosphoribosylglycinamide formyltransferase [Bacteroidota bacterium]